MCKNSRKIYYQTSHDLVEFLKQKEYDLLTKYIAKKSFNWFEYLRNIIFLIYFSDSLHRCVII